MRAGHTWICSFLLMLAFASLAQASPRQEIITGPVTGEVLQVLDGDTVTVRLHVWLGQEIETSVRINGIDAPEIHGKCEKERTLARRARNALAEIIGNKKIELYNIRLEKYAGRVLADAQTSSGIKIGAHLIGKGLAREYHGEKRRGWCE